MGDLTNRIAGTAYLSVNGRTVPLEGSFSYSPVRVTRETKSGQDHVHGYSEMPSPGVIKASIRDSGGLKVADFNAMSDVPIVCYLANGKVVSGRNMWTVETQEVDTAEAKFEVTWNGFDGSVTED